MTTITIIKNGSIYTGDPRHPLVQAVAVRDGKVIDVGDNDDIRLQWERSGTEVIDLQGKTVTPGLIDSHLHLSGVASKFLDLDLADVTSKDELLKRIKAKADKTPPGKWVTGRGWNENLFPDSQIPTLEELDWAAPYSPLFLTRICGHAFLANSQAFEISQYCPEMANPSGGTIVQDPHTKKPTGLILESAAEVIQRNIPEPSYEDLKQAMKQAVALALKHGLTSVHTEDLRYLGGLDQTYQIYDELINEEELGLRCNLLVDHTYVNKLIERKMYTGFGNDRLQIGAVKIFADGALGGRTALMSEPYQDDRNNFGFEIHSQESLYHIVSQAKYHNMPVAVHAIGDKALENVLTVLDRFPQSKYRDRIIHAQILRPDLITCLKRGNRIVDIQPRFVVSDFPWVIDRLGDRRLQHAYIWKTMIDSGITCAGGSDAPVEPIDPLLGIHAAVTRKSPNSDRVRNERERLSISEAIHLFTAGGAYATNEEHVKGTISVGKWADMTVYSQNIFAIHPDELLTTNVEMTIIGGKIQYASA